MASRWCWNQIRRVSDEKCLPFACSLTYRTIVGQGGLGLGAASTFLTALVDIGAAPSRSFGLWTGSTSTSKPVDGLLVIGGYDSVRKQGQFTRFPNFNRCWACVVATRITYDYSNGSTSLFSSTEAKIQFGVDPYFNTLQFPQDMFEVFMAASGGVYDSSLGHLTYPKSNSSMGNITVTLDDGKMDTRQ